MKRKIMLAGFGILTLGALGTVTAFAATTNQNPNNLPSSGATKAQHQRAHEKMFVGADIAKIIGITPQTLKADLQKGLSLAQIAQTEKGMSEQTLIQNIEAAQKANLDKAVQNGKLTETQEMNILNNMDTKVTKLVEHKGGFSTHKKWHKAARIYRLDDISSILGIDKATLKAELKSGKSIVEIAQTKNMDEATLTNKLRANLQTKLDKAVKAGKMTSEKQQAVLKKFDSNISKVLNRKGGFSHKKSAQSQPSSSSSSRAASASETTNA